MHYHPHPSLPRQGGGKRSPFRTAFSWFMVSRRDMNNCGLISLFYEFFEPVSMRKSRMVITCAKGVPPFLKEEVLSLGLPVLSEAIAGVETEGMMDDAMRLNLFLRVGRGIGSCKTSFKKVLKRRRGFSHSNRFYYGFLKFLPKRIG